MPGRVMLVEDQPDFKHFCRIVLERAGFEVVEARTGREALAMARSHPPRVMLLDGRLPDISGWEVLEAMLRDPDLSKVPVAMLTADVEDDRQEAAFVRGAAAYLTKPVAADELVKTVRALIGEQ